MTIKLSVLQFLLRGHQAELLYPDRAYFIDKAHELLTSDNSLNDLQRARIRAVWLEGKYLPPISDRIDAP